MYRQLLNFFDSIFSFIKMSKLLKRTNKIENKQI